MSNNRCARAVMLAAIAAGGLASTAKAVPASSTNEVTLSDAVATSAPLAHLAALAPKPRSVNVDQGNMHVHINEQTRPGESIFEV